MFKLHFTHSYKINVKVSEVNVFPLAFTDSLMQLQLHSHYSYTEELHRIQLHKCWMKFHFLFSLQAHFVSPAHSLCSLNLALNFTWNYICPCVDLNETKKNATCLIQNSKGGLLMLIQMERYLIVLPNTSCMKLDLEVCQKWKFQWFNIFTMVQNIILTCY